MNMFQTPEGFLQNILQSLKIQTISNTAVAVCPSVCGRQIGSVHAYEEAR